MNGLSIKLVSASILYLSLFNTYASMTEDDSEREIEYHCIEKSEQIEHDQRVDFMENCIAETSLFEIEASGT